MVAKALDKGNRQAYISFLGAVVVVSHCKIKENECECLTPPRNKGNMYFHAPENVVSVLE